jgi:hypothetical protein
VLQSFCRPRRPGKKQAVAREHGIFQVLMVEAADNSGAMPWYSFGDRRSVGLMSDCRTAIRIPANPPRIGARLKKENRP